MKFGRRRRRKVFVYDARDTRVAYCTPVHLGYIVMTGVRCSCRSCVSSPGARSTVGSKISAGAGRGRISWQGRLGIRSATRIEIVPFSMFVHHRRAHALGARPCRWHAQALDPDAPGALYRLVDLLRCSQSVPTQTGASSHPMRFCARPAHGGMQDRVYGRVDAWRGRRAELRPAGAFPPRVADTHANACTDACS